MDEKDHLIELLRQQVNKYERRVHYLENLLKEADISYKGTKSLLQRQSYLLQSDNI